VGGEYAEGRGNVLIDWGRIGGGGEDTEGVDEKKQKELLGGRTLDCSTEEGEKVNGVRIGIRK
jgi:hypothetical protein